MYHVSTVPLSELNQHFICGLCFGYIVDATTIIECPHSFCRSCLVQYLTTENCCPLCGQLVHKTKPLDYICADKILQDLAYKLIPNLYTNEKQRRQDFRASLKESTSCAVDNWSEEDHEKSPVLDTSDVNERLSVCLQLADARQPPDHRAKIRSNDRRYLLCPAYVSVSVLKKFIHVKFELSTKHHVAMFYADEDLPDHYTLTDVATLYGWRRLCPLKLFYIVYNPSRLRHFLPDRASLSYVAYRKLIKKHRRRRRLRRDSTHDEHHKDSGTVPATPNETVEVASTCDSRDLSRPVAADTAAVESTTVVAPSSVSHSTAVNSCTTVASRSSFSITRLLSLSEDGSSGDDAKSAADVNADVRKLSTCSTSVGRTPAVTAAVEDRIAGDGEGRSTASDAKPAMPVHFKKRMLNTATGSQSVSVGAQLTVIGRSPSTPRRRSFVIHEDADPSTSSPLAKVGIVISHGRSMTLQDKLQMTTNGARLSPSSVDARARPLHTHNRHSTPAAPPHRKPKRHSTKPVVKRSLLPAPKAAGGDENETCGHADDAKRPRRRSSKRSELELLLQLDGGTLAASAEFRKANTLRPCDNILPATSFVTYDVLKTSVSDAEKGDRTQDLTCQQSNS